MCGISSVVSLFFSWLSKRQIVFGMRNPAFAAPMSTKIVMAAAVRDVISEPMNFARMRKKISKTTAAKRQNGRTGKASMKDLFLPNMRVMMPTTTKMMRSAPTAMPRAEMKESPSFQVSKSVMPIEGSISLTMSAAAFVGVPAAPKGTGVEFRIKQEIAAAIGGKPRPIKSGAAIAAGVPKPAAPSMKALNAKPTMTSWMRASSVMPLNMP